MILPLDELHILIMNVYNITRICDDVERVLPGCSQCIYELPCTCTLHTNSTYITPHVRNYIRDNQTLNRTLLPKTHVTNLAVLASYFSSENLMQLTAGRILNHPISAVLPNFSFLDNKFFRHVGAALEETKFDLSKAVNLSISRQMAFRTIVEYLSHQHAIHYDMQDTNDYFFGMFNRFRTPLAIVSIGLSVVALTFTVIVSVKIRTLSLLLLNVRPVKAAKIQLFCFYYN